MAKMQPAGDKVSLQPFFDELKQHLRKSTATALRERRTPRQARAAADTTMDAYTSTVAGLERFAPPEHPLACRKGCDHCCHLTVLADAATVIRIADYVRETFTPGERMLLDMRLIAYEDKVEGQTQAQRSLSRVACPLLVDGACSVHPVRPLICRSFNSYDVEACVRHLAPGGSSADIPSWTVPWLVGLALDAGLKDALVESSYTDGDLELGLALKAALDRPNTAERWLAGDALFARAQWKARQP
jgi:Fe-S-cluster containining protein